MVTVIRRSGPAPKHHDLSPVQVTAAKNADYLYGTIKGNPYTLHVMKRSEFKALCGHKPGASKGTNRMKDRTGWNNYYIDAEMRGARACETCMARLLNDFADIV